MEEPSVQPALLEATPSSTALSNLPSIFDIMMDPRQSLDDIESYVLADPSCVKSAHPQSGCSPLHEAARRADTRLIRFFLDQGAEIDARSSSGETPLMTASEVQSNCTNTEILDTILRLGNSCPFTYLLFFSINCNYVE